MTSSDLRGWDGITAVKFVRFAEGGGLGGYSRRNTCELQTDNRQAVFYIKRLFSESIEKRKFS